jgi:hypothetical protein
VAAHELVAHRVERVADGEIPGLLADAGEEDRLEQEVAELVAQLGRRPLIDRLEHLVRLLEDEAAQRGVRLLAVPGASAGLPQPGHDPDQPLEARPDRVWHARDATTRERVLRFRRMSQHEEPSGPAPENPEVTFVGFVLSLAHTAAFHFGDVADPMSGQKGELNLPAAQQLIDILSLLEEKTRGNLTAEERQLLEQLLAELRLRYEEASGGASGQSSRIIMP